jgi:hypothetical protein
MTVKSSGGSSLSGAQSKLTPILGREWGEPSADTSLEQ